MQKNPAQNSVKRNTNENNASNLSKNNDTSLNKNRPNPYKNSMQKDKATMCSNRNYSLEETFIK